MKAGTVFMSEARREKSMSKEEILSELNFEELANHLCICGWRETSISVERKIREALERGESTIYGEDYNGCQVAYTFM
jgi:hypothetical protein